MSGCNPLLFRRVGNYVQLTHDGQPKSLIGTDGARLYLGTGVGSSGSFILHGVAEMSVAGGEPKIIGASTSTDMIAVDLSRDGSDLLVVEGQGAPPRGPLRSVPVLGGSPRRLAESVAETAAWSNTGRMLAYNNLGDLFIAKADGSEPRKMLTVGGDIRHIAWSPDDSHLRFDSSESAGTVGQQSEWEVAVDGTGLHRLFEGWHNPPDECCGKWTADGKYFVFQSEGQIWALAGSGGRFHSDPKPIALTSSPMTLSSPLPSRDGKKLFVIGRTYRGELMRYDAKSAGFAAFLNGVSAEYLNFSKDGQWVAYVSYPDGALWRSKVDGSDACSSHIRRCILCCPAGLLTERKSFSLSSRLVQANLRGSTRWQVMEEPARASARRPRPATRSDMVSRRFQNRFRRRIKQSFVYDPHP